VSIRGSKRSATQAHEGASAPSPISAGGRRASVLPLSLPPRGLSRVKAAAYIGVSPTTFDAMMQRREMPRPKRIGARAVWDRLKLDAAFAAIPGNDDHDQGNPFD
jgi:predicted DNA-binding transcriptional regulator AlpA